MALAAYAKKKGVHLVGPSRDRRQHRASTSSSWARRSICTQKLGIDAVKTGYVADAGGVQALGDDGRIHFEWHDGQVHVASSSACGRPRRRSATSR